MRLIDADELLTDPYFQDNSMPERFMFIEAVEDSPTISPDSLVKRGRWEEYEVPRIICCSECDWGTSPSDREQFKYCPNCGAKMDEGGALMED